jgi:hypothetical protein
VKSTRSETVRYQVTMGGEGVVNHAGTAVLAELADKLGLTGCLSKAMNATRGRRSLHDRGRVLRDLAVMLADGGDCVSDLATLRDQPELFGEVASTATAWRVMDGAQLMHLSALREARCHARKKAWSLGVAPEEIVLDFDATLVTSHSEKEKAAPTFKRGFGFHPLLCFLDESHEALAGKLRPGNAGSDTSADHLEVLYAALAQLPDQAFKKRILARADSAGASHRFLDALREVGIRYSVGFHLKPEVKQAILNTPESAWLPASTQDGEVREGAAVCELTGALELELDLWNWPPGSRLICRRERPHPGAQLTFSDSQGYRFQVFITDQRDKDIISLELRHRGRARTEDRIRCAKESGLDAFPFHRFTANEAWLELVLIAQDLMTFLQRLCLRGEAQAWEPKRMRYRLLHTAARIVRTGRRVILRLHQRWRWTPQLYGAFLRLRSLPA